MWIVLIGGHDEESAENIYDELYQLLEIDPPDTARTKPPCCDEADQSSPPVIDGLLDDIIDRARRL